MKRVKILFDEFYLHKVTFIIFVVILSCLISLALDRIIVHSNPATLFDCESNLKYINPYPDCEKYLEKIENFANLQSDLETLVNNLEHKNGVERVAVFSRDMITRRFVGVHEDESFFMASLLKVPLLVAWYKLAEVEPSLLNKTYIYNGIPNLYSEQLVQPRDKLVIGKTYTIDELIERSIIYSDNTAAQILADNLPREMIDRILRALGIQFERDPGIYENFITAKSYANVFRILYNSSYLTRQFSDKGLEILSRSDFTDGMRSVVSSGVVVASKFGERTTIHSDGKVVKQLHECGLVYNKHAKEPYSFCILTEGTDYNQLLDSIREVSRTIYEANK